MYASNLDSKKLNKMQQTSKYCVSNAKIDAWFFLLSSLFEDYEIILLSHRKGGCRFLFFAKAPF
jgi:hypothetical protein